MTEQKNILGLEVELQDGQTWDDRITVDMTREQWAMAVVMLMAESTEMTGVLENCHRDAENGNLMATLMLPHLIDSHRLMSGVVVHVMHEVFPELNEQAMEEVKRRARANADA